MWQHLTVALFCLSLRTDDAELFSFHSLLPTCCLWQHVYSSPSSIFYWVAFWLSNYESSLYILGTTPFQNVIAVFSLPTGCLFTFWMVSFDAWNFYFSYWSIIDTQYFGFRCTTWFNICIYLKMVTSLVNIHHHPQLQNLLSLVMRFKILRFTLKICWPPESYTLRHIKA